MGISDASASEMGDEATTLLPFTEEEPGIKGYSIHEFNGASFSGAVFNLSTTIVGAGIMALPASIKMLGIIPGILMIILVAWLTEVLFFLGESKELLRFLNGLGLVDGPVLWNLFNSKQKSTSGQAQARFPSETAYGAGESAGDGDPGEGRGGGDGETRRARGFAGRALYQRLPHGPRRAPGPFTTLAPFPSNHGVLIAR